MRQVILQIDISIDGFIAGPNAESDWITDASDMNQEALTLLDSVDTILLGRVAYEDFIQFWPTADVDAPNIIGKIANKLNHADKIIFSKTLDKVEWGTWNNARLVKDNIAEEITAIKAHSGKHLLLYAGASIVSTFTRLDLIDEYRLRIHPFILGSGKPLFHDIDDRKKLKMVNTKAYQNGAVLLDYHRADQ